jgi:hypothetical protein
VRPRAARVCCCLFEEGEKKNMKHGGFFYALLACFFFVAVVLLRLFAVYCLLCVSLSSSCPSILSSLYPTHTNEKK